MCFSQVGEVREVIGEKFAVCDVDGAERRVSLAVLILEGANAEVGDWLLIHTGLAVAVLEPDAARELGALHREIAGSDVEPHGQGP